jgi:predicted patatin/cPLA2 family phospholipase
MVGTSTGSLLIPHLSLNKVNKLKKIFTNVNQSSIFNINPFVIKSTKGQFYVTINYINTLLQFIRKKRTFGESKNLRKTIEKSFTIDEFLTIKKSKKDIVVTVSNLSKNKIEYKSINDFEYQDFLDWIWISCNMIPFMSLVTKNKYKYADGGFGSMVPIRECIKRGATEIDVIILEPETNNKTKLLGKNPFDLMLSLFGFMIDQVEINDIREGKLTALYNDVILNIYYTPTSLTNNSLVFDKELMNEWWEQGFLYAKNRFDN